MATQLHQVLSVLSDGQWHSLPEISQKLSIKKRSAGSRIRDLRLSSYGKHHIEVRKTSNYQVFEYRLTSQSNTPNPAIGNISLAALLHPMLGELSIKFLNVQSMDVEYHPRSQCAMHSVGGFQRLVALDSSGQIIEHFITTQDTL